MMSPSPSWFRRGAAWTLALTLGTWACGDGGGSVTPPPETKAVSSVTVTPSEAEIEAGETVGFTATLVAADGTTLTDRTVTWSVSSQAVATVSSAGLVTGVGAGEATITATAEGRSGTAAVLVTQPGLLAAGTVGPEGGSVGNEDVGVTVLPGQLSSSTRIEILTTEDPIEEFGEDLVTGRYLLQGFPQDRQVEVRVRLRTTGSLRDQSYIGMAVPVVMSSTDTLEAQRGLVLQEAVDSAGYLVATMPIRGSDTQTSSQGPEAVAPSSGVDQILDGLLGGVTGVRADTVPGNHFVIVSFGAPWSELQSKVGRAAKLLEDARSTLLAQGYSMDHRSEWPIEVRVHPMREGLYGSFAQKLPWPLNVNTGYFNLNTWAFDQSDMPGTAIHEFYHFVQARYTGGMLANQAVGYGWVNEAGSTWMEEKAPETIGVFRNSFFQGHRRNLFTGLYPGLSAKHGYGKAPIIKYVADRWGTTQVRNIFELVGGGTGAVDAVLQSIPESPETWWPDLLTKYMKGEIIALAPEDLPPPVGESPLKPGVWDWTRSSSPLRSLGAQFSQFTPNPTDYGSGTNLIVRLPPELTEAGFKILPFRMDAAGSWEEQGGVADSLVIEGKDLRLGRRYGFFVLHTAPSAPYSQSWTNEYVTDLGYADGDWMPQEIAVVNDAIEYVRPSQEDDTEIDVADNIVSVFESLSGGGTWKRSASDPNHYVWEPTEDFAGMLATYNVTASSEAKVLATGDSLYINAMFDMAPPASGGPPGSALLGGGWMRPGAAGGWGGRGSWGGIGAFALATALLLAGLALRRNRRMLVLTAAGAAGLVFWGCDLASIDFTARFRYEFRFANPDLTASAEDLTVPLVLLSGGSGVFTVDRYRSEWWKYIRDEEGEVVDSVAQVRTATGQATVDLGAVLYRDGIITDEEESALSRASRLLQLPEPELSGILKTGGHR